MEITHPLAQLLVHVAVGDAVKLSPLREICSWFLDLPMLYEEAVGIADCLTNEEKVCMRPNNSLPVEYLYRAMMEADSDDPVQRYRWKAYKSRCADDAAHGAGQGAGHAAGQHGRGQPGPRRWSWRCGSGRILSCRCGSGCAARCLVSQPV